MTDSTDGFLARAAMAARASAAHAVMAVAAASLAGCGGTVAVAPGADLTAGAAAGPSGDGASVSELPNPVSTVLLPGPELLGPRSLDRLYSPAPHAEGHFAHVNYNWNMGEAGLNVKIGILDAGIDVDHPALADLTVTVPITVMSAISQGNIEHGTIVALLAAGRIDRTVYGVAYGSEIEFVCCVVTADEEGDARAAFRYLGETSDAFVVNNSWGFNDEHEYRISDVNRCAEKMVAGNPVICSTASSFRFLVPSDSLEYIEDGEFLKACADPDSAAVNRRDGTKERICVFAGSNDGLNPQGRIIGVYTLHIFGARINLTYIFNVEDLLGDESPLSDADRALFRQRLYARSGTLNLPDEDPRYAGHFLVVAALQEGMDVLADFSNACGDAMMHCLSAPGDIPFDTCATDPTGVCDGRSRGTSLSAPIVSGAAALLKSTYPNLSAPNVVEILLETAEDIGVPGPDSLFGMGKLDVGRSLQPVGTRRSLSGETFEDSVILASPSLGAALSRSRASFGMFDEYERPYLYALSGRSVPRRSGSVVDDHLHDSAELLSSTLRQRMGLEGAGHARKAARDGAAWIGGAGAPSAASGVELCSSACSSRHDARVSSLVPSSAVAWTEQRYPVEGGKVGFLLEAGLNRQLEAEFVSGGIFVARRAEQALLRIEAGALLESDTFMGSDFGGALAVGPGNGRYLSAHFGSEIGEGAFSARYTVGRERPGKPLGSYVAEVSDVTYDGYRVAYGLDGWELSYTAPLSATRGGIRIESVGGYTGENGDWSIVDAGDRVAVVGRASGEDWEYRTDSHWTDFGAGGRERRLGLLHASEAGGWETSLSVEHVRNSPREGHSGDEIRASVGFRLEFD